MKHYQPNASASLVTRCLRGKGALACLAALMLAALTQPAIANRPVSGVTADLQAADIMVREGEQAIFRFWLSSRLDFDVRYAYRTQDLTAKAGEDYEAKHGYVVFPAGKPFAEVQVKTLKDDDIDNEHFELVLSDVQTHGYGKVWGQYIWTSWWRVEGLPDTKTVSARIRNVLDNDGLPARVGNAKQKR